MLQCSSDRIKLPVLALTKYYTYCLFTKAKYHGSVVKENRNEITVNKNTISRYITSMAEFQQSKQ